jgi:hypothetical protein
MAAVTRGPEDFRAERTSLSPFSEGFQRVDG